MEDATPNTALSAEELTVINELADTDPVAAALANRPHKFRHLAEAALAHAKDPFRRFERSDRERELNLPGRWIVRDMREIRRFLSNRCYTDEGVRESERRLRQMAKKKVV